MAGGDRFGGVDIPHCCGNGLAAWSAHEPLLHLMYDAVMRTTLDIDGPVLDALKELARRQGRTAGSVASELIRRALTQPAATGVQEPAARYGFQPFPAQTSDDRVTNEQVNRLRDDLGI